MFINHLLFAKYSFLGRRTISKSGNSSANEPQTVLQQATSGAVAVSRLDRKKIDSFVTFERLIVDTIVKVRSSSLHRKLGARTDCQSIMQTAWQYKSSTQQRPASPAPALTSTTSASCRALIKLNDELMNIVCLPMTSGIRLKRSVNVLQPM